MLTISSRISPKRSSAIEAIGVGPEGITVRFRQRYGESPFEYVLADCGEYTYQDLAKDSSLGRAVTELIHCDGPEPIRVKRNTYLP